jgi:hypothetical protein
MFIVKPVLKQPGHNQNVSTTKKVYSPKDWEYWASKFQLPVYDKTHLQQKTKLQSLAVPLYASFTVLIKSCVK